MSYDGTLKFDTKVDTTGFNTGTTTISRLASGAIKTTAAIIAGGAVAVAGLGAAAIKVGTDFEASMSNVAAISGATGDELDALTLKAQEMGAKTKFSASESADAFSYMAMAGWKTADMLDGIEGIMNLAAASGEDLATTSDIVTDALTALGMEANESAHFADILAAASSNSNTNVAMMGETFKYAAAMAGTLHYSAEDVAVAVGLMANSGIKASMAGTSLNTIMTRLSTNTNGARDACEDLGVAFFNEDGSARELGAVMEELRVATANMTDEEKANFAKKVAGISAQKGLLAILNASEDDYNKLTDAIYNCTDAESGYSAAAEMAAIQLDNFQGQLTILKSALEGFGIKVYQELDGPLKEVVKTAQDMVQQLSDAFDEGGFEGLVSAVGDVLAQAVTKIASAVPDFIDAGVSLVESFIASLIGNEDEVASAGAEIVTSLSNAVIRLSGDLWSAGIELLAKLLQGVAENADEIGRTAAETITQLAASIAENAPIIIQAGKDIVDGFLEGLSEEFPGIAAFFQGLFDGIYDTVSGAVDGIVALFGQIFDAVNSIDPAVMRDIGEAIGKIAVALVAVKTASSIVTTIKKIGSAFSGLMTTVKTVVQFFSGTFGGIILVISGVIIAVKNFVDQFQNGFDAVKEILMLVGIAIATVGAIILGVAAWPAVIVAAVVAACATLAIIIKEHWDEIVAWVQNAWESIKSFFASIPETVGTFFSDIFTTVGDFFSGVWTDITTFFSELPGTISEFFSSIITSVAEFFANLFSSIGTFLAELPYKIGYALGLVIGNIIQFGIDCISWVTENVPKIINGIVTFFSELPGKIWDWLVNAYNNIVQWGIDAWNWLTETVPQIIEDVSTFFSELPGKIWTWLTNAYNNVVTWGSNTWSTATTWVTNTINSIVTWFSTLPGKIWTWLTTTIQNVIAFGSNLLSTGITAATNFLNGFVNIVSSIPSQMYNIGMNIVYGVWNGICAVANWFWSQVTGFFSGIVDGVKSSLGIASPSKVFAEEVGEWIPPGVGEGVEDAMPGLLKTTRDQMSRLSDEMKATVETETGKISFEKTGQQAYEQAAAERISQRSVTVTGQLESERPIVVHTNLHVDKRKFAEEITPAVNSELYRIDSSENNRGRGN